ncbi:hypothetical protein [Elizabethkingia ursingii]|uniref:hypothetical protein n=1 Tax=Elizabethkingia ursingii TaxID=1756150 RepID=UPI000751037F|nr:hypothetical protein [Elizabethkingia ursingii]KUY29396.1 hypothetical protein ATB96_18950 [Elizabethkingia ursingii]
MLIGLILISLGIIMAIKQIRKKPSEKKCFQTEGEVLNNKYVKDHEKKILDDKEYEEYLEWCLIKGEAPAEKDGFDKYRMEEYHMYKKLLKYGISGLSK